MLANLSRYWWLVVLRGVAAVLFGVLAILFPGPALAVLVIGFGVYALVDGISSVITAFSHRATNDRWWVLLIEGLVGIAAGIITLFRPGNVAFILYYVIASWAIITGVMEILAAIRLRKEIDNEWMLALSGVASLLFGLILFILQPAVGGALIIWLIAAYAIAFGILFIVLGLRLRGMSNTTMQPA